MARARYFLVLISAIAVQACGGANDGAGPNGMGPGQSPGAAENAAAIDSYVRSLDDAPLPEDKRVEGPRGAARSDGTYSCAPQPVSETRRFDHVVAYSANSDSMWPGAVVRGDALTTGLFTPLVFERKPMSFSVSLENLAGKKSGTMDNPSLSNFRDVLGELLAAGVTGATAANISSEIEEVHSKKQLELALGASGSWVGNVASITGSFDFDKAATRSRYVVRYIQTYYTVDVDAPPSPSALFGPSVTLDELKSKAGEGIPPAYVSSVSYGRMILFTFESTHSTEELGAALKFAYKGGADVSGDVSVTYKEMLSSSKITAFILGGSGGDAAKSIDSYEKLMDLIRGGGNYSKDSPGSPIAYSLRYLKDNSPAAMAFTSDYSVSRCERVGQKVHVTLRSIKVESAGTLEGGELELFGSVTVSATGGGQTNPVKDLFRKPPTAYVTIKEGQSFPTTGVAGETIVDVTPKPGNAIELTVDLTEFDTSDPNDVFGVTKVSLPFESGWRRLKPVTVTKDGMTVTMEVGLQPVE